MAQPVSKYNGNYVTCYPGSNQQDDGKLQLEYNMARIVTRLSSKNFCTVNPSYTITKITDPTTSKPALQLSEGQCSINGMDLIMTSTINIAQPDGTGTFYLKFKLARDSSDNVLGDFIYGTDTTFDGVYLTYDTQKSDPLSPDELYLAKINWNGTDFTSIEEDEDKYGRLWADDILCKIDDPKHPDITRLTLQEWIYKVPDWYVSKDSDVEYGFIKFLAGRSGSTTPGITIQAKSNNLSSIEFNAPSASNQNLKGSIKADTQGITFNLGNAYITNRNTDFDLLLYNTKDITLQSSAVATMKGQSCVLQSNSSSGYNLTAKSKNLTFTDSTSSDLKFNVNISSADILTQTVGKSIWQYNDANKILSLLSTNTNGLTIQPTTTFSNDARVTDDLYLGASDSLPQTVLSRTQWYLRQNVANGKVLSFTPSLIETINPSLSNSNNIVFNMRNSNNTIHTKLYDNGIIELLNNTKTPQMLFKDGNTSYDVVMSKTLNKKELAIRGNLTVNGTVRGTKVLNAVYNGFGEIFRKDKNESIEYGDIVCVREDGLVHRVQTTEDLNTIIGVCSNTIGVQLGGKDIPENEQVEVEMVGQIWIKTDNSNIKPGQLIKPLINGKCDVTNNNHEKLGVSISNVINGKVRVVYNG